eukprot:6185807-Pleurochrysis_carterae.AAC.2
MQIAMRCKLQCDKVCSRMTRYRLQLALRNVPDIDKSASNFDVERLGHGLNFRSGLLFCTVSLVFLTTYEMTCNLEKTVPSIFTSVSFGGSICASWANISQDG